MIGCLYSEVPIVARRSRFNSLSVLIVFCAEAYSSLHMLFAFLTATCAVIFLLMVCSIVMLSAPFGFVFVVMQERYSMLRFNAREIVDIFRDKLTTVKIYYMWCLFRVLTYCMLCVR